MALAEKSNTSSTQMEQIDVINPVTQAVIGQIPITPPEAVAKAVERAHHAQRFWGKLAVKDRARLISKWRDLLYDHQEEGIRILRRENGKTDGGAFIEFMVVDNIAHYYIHNAARILKPDRRRPLFPIIQRATVLHKPRGVVGVISPWNYPLALPFMDSIAALMAGNAVILKPSEITPFIADFAVNLMHEAGIPQDLIQVVHGDGSTGAAIVEHVDYVQFTGSVAVGRKVGVRCAERLIPFSLELGGKDASIILNDADLDHTAAGLIAGAYENSGQMCISVDRAYVESGIYDRLIERIQHYAKDIILSAGDGLHVTVGSMTNSNELERVQTHIDDAVSKGAKILFGGKARPDIGPLFFEPTCLIDVDHSMDVLRHETFGPVLSIMRVANADEAVRLANDSQYGLSASIFSSDLNRAESIAARLNSGDVNINRPQFSAGTPSVPFGGQKNSGLGRRNGPEGLLKYTASQSIITDRLWGTKPSVVIADETTVNLARKARSIRKLLPFL